MQMPLEAVTDPILYALSAGLTMPEITERLYQLDLVNGVEVGVEAQHPNKSIGVPNYDDCPNPYDPKKN